MVIDFPATVLFVPDFPVFDVSERSRVIDTQEIEPVVSCQRRRRAGGPNSRPFPN